MNLNFNDIQELMQDPRFAAIFRGSGLPGVFGDGNLPDEPGMHMPPRPMDEVMRPDVPDDMPMPGPMPGPGRVPPVGPQVPLPLGVSKIPPPDGPDPVSMRPGQMPDPNSPVGRIMAMQHGPPEQTTFDSPEGSILMAGGRDKLIPPMPPGPPSFGRRLKAALPGLLAGAIAGGASPNHAGGGMSDIFRSMQAGGAEQDRRGNLAYTRARQQFEDANKHAHDLAQMQDWNSQARMRDAQTKYYEAQANVKAEVKPSDDLYKKYTAETDPEKKETLKDLWLQSLGHPEKPKTVWSKLGPGQEINRETGEIRTVDQQAAMDAREEQVRKSYGTDPWMWPHVKQTKLTPQDRAFILGSKAPGAERAPTRASIALDAAGGDPVKALESLRTPRAPVDPLVEEARRQRLEEGRAKEFDVIEKTKGAELLRAQQYQDSALKALRAQDSSKDDKSPEAQKIRKTALGMMQDAMNRYTESIRRHGGTADNWHVMEDGSMLTRDALAAAGGKVPDNKAALPAPTKMPTPATKTGKSYLDKY